MTDQPKLTKRQECGLRDIWLVERSGGNHYWQKPATMRELANLGLVKRLSRFTAAEVWWLTDAGRARAKTLKGG